MRAIIVGAGEVGFHVADRLSKQGHEIVMVDLKPERLDYVQSHLDIGIVEGSGASPVVLEEAGVKQAELLVAVTSVDEVNLVTCMGSRGQPGMVKVARVSNPDFYTDDHRFHPSRFDVDVMISPEQELANDALRILQSTVATDIAVFAEGGLQVVAVPIPDDAPVTGKTLREVTAEIGDLPILTATIERDGSPIIPTGSTVLRPGDHAYIVATPSSVPVALKLCGQEQSTLKSAMIAGGSGEAYYLTKLLLQHGVQTTVIVSERKRAQEFAEKLERALVLNGDATDIELLELEGVGDVDAFVSLTDEDQHNIFSSLVAKHSGAKQVVTMVSRLEYVPLARRIGLDAAVSPRLSAANAIMGHIHRGSVTRISAFKDTSAEAISFAVSSASPLVGRPLAELDFPEGALVAAIARGSQVIVPRGRDSLEPGDDAVVFALPDAVAEVTKLFPT